jgi:hypothetical protein
LATPVRPVRGIARHRLKFRRIESEVGGARFGGFCGVYCCGHFCGWGGLESACGEVIPERQTYLLPSEMQIMINEPRTTVAVMLIGLGKDGGSWHPEWVWLDESSPIGLAHFPTYLVTVWQSVNDDYLLPIYHCDFSRITNSVFLSRVSDTKPS